MKGMLLKECYVLSSMAKTYLIMLGVFTVLSATGVYDTAFITSMFSVILVMTPISGFAYDEQAGWEKYAVSTPAGRKGVVRGKYLFALLMGAVGFCVGLLLNLVVFLARSGDASFGDSLVFSASALCVGMLILAILIPLIFKFGSQRSRVLLIIVIASITGMGGALMAIGTISGVFKQMAPLLSLLLPVVALGALVISYFTSMSIYQKKEL